MGIIFFQAGVIAQNTCKMYLRVFFFFLLNGDSIRQSKNENKFIEGDNTN